SARRRAASRQCRGLERSRGRLCLARTQRRGPERLRDRPPCVPDVPGCLRQPPTNGEDARNGAAGARRLLEGHAVNDQSPESPAPERWMRWAPPALLVALTLAAFMPTLRNGFVAWDDLDNFTLNQSYRGLGWPQIKWMFTSAKLGHYIPVTWLTLGLDYVLWGMNAAGYHLTSLLIHAGGALALYFLALRLFELARPEAPPLDLRVGAFLASLVFAVHPFRVESVAWVTERRDVVSGLFYVLTVLAYLKAVAGRERPRPGWYVASLGLFAAALLSKSIVVTLPAALVILDVYPLRRLSPPLAGPPRGRRPVHRDPRARPRNVSERAPGRGGSLHVPRVSRLGPAPGRGGGGRLGRIERDARRARDLDPCPDAADVAAGARLARSCHHVAARRRGVSQCPRGKLQPGRGLRERWPLRRGHRALPGDPASLRAEGPVVRAHGRGLRESEGLPAGDRILPRGPATRSRPEQARVRRTYAHPRADFTQRRGAAGLPGRTILDAPAAVPPARAARAGARVTD